MSFIPPISEDGFRYYNRWAGDPKGVQENKERCIQEVRDSGTQWPRYHQCNNRRGHGPDGNFCKTHDPERVAKRQAARREARVLEWKQESERLRWGWAGRDALSILRQIAEGHNDPGTLARDFLSKHTD